MPKCPNCGAEAYIGLQWIECTGVVCKYFVPKGKYNKARIHWDINGRVGHSRWLDLEEAVRRVREGNKRFGTGTHWLEEEIDGELLSWLKE